MKNTYHFAFYFRNKFLKEKDLSDKFDITIEKQSISSLADIEVDTLADDLNENL